MKKMFIVATLSLSIVSPSISAEYLGRIGSNPFCGDCTANPFDPIVNPYAENSLTNPYGPYGNPYSAYSAYNSYSVDTPEVYGTADE